MVYNLVSVKKVIAKVFTDLNLQEGTHRIEDMIEWAGEALEKINAFPALEKKVAGKGGEPLLKVANYQTLLPPNTHSISQVAYSETGKAPFYPMRTSTGSFDEIKGATVESIDPGTGLPVYTVEDEKGAQFSYERNLTYVVVPGYIKTNVKDGYLLVAYTSIPVDSDGYPMMPDDISFTEALYWYITVKLLYPEWKEGRVRDMVFFEARRSWNFYCKQAYGNAYMPNADQLESLKNAWLKIVPEMHDNNTFFSTTGEEQNIYNAN